MTLGTIERQLCDICGRLFELALRQGYDSESFIKAFMNSKSAQGLDDTYDRLQWAGEEYILENLKDETNMKKAGIAYPNETMYWIGYTYRYWHYYKSESSSEIYKKADCKTMNEVYMGFHTLDVEMAIDNLIEIWQEKIKKQKSKKTR